MTQKPIEKITQAEYQVMEILWEQAPLAASQIAKLIAPQTSWSLTTVKTLLARLTEKSILKHQQEGRRFLYEPTISRSDYTKVETRQFVDKLFNGRAAPLVAHLAQSPNGLSADDIAELEILLESLKNDAQ